MKNWLTPSVFYLLCVKDERFQWPITFYWHFLVLTSTPKKRKAFAVLQEAIYIIIRKFMNSYARHNYKIMLLISLLCLKSSSKAKWLFGFLMKNSLIMSVFCLLWAKAERFQWTCVVLPTFSSSDLNGKKGISFCLEQQLAFWSIPSTLCETTSL